MPPQLYRQAEYDVCTYKVKTSKTKNLSIYDQENLRYIIPATVECEVGLANLEAEFCKPTLLEEIMTPVYMYNQI